MLGMWGLIWLNKFWAAVSAGGIDAICQTAG
jgi:hypothetical protein